MSSERQDPCSIGLQRYNFSGATMGTRYSAVFFAEAGRDESALAARLFAAVNKVDQQMSTWKPDSDLSRLNASPLQQWVEVPEELVAVLATSLGVSRQSHGAFDIGVGALVNAWGFGPGTPQPDAHQISILKKQAYQPACNVVDIDDANNRVRKRAAITLDLSGIAKGFGVDEMARCLDSFGITSYLVGIDGEMRARGLKPDGRTWAIAVEKPVRGVREAMGVMELTDAAIATSGDYRHWVQIADTYYAHTMNPSLGSPSRTRVAAVTVVATTCMLADAWATALLVLGEDAGAQLAQERNMNVLFVLRDGEGFQEISIVDGQRELQV
ncbi:FAD:protein FMN transferase [Aromatoleum aromaticum]|nr:FAD:protein FMN transferase [Aromatoleum aromaticum]